MSLERFKYPAVIILFAALPLVAQKRVHGPVGRCSEGNTFRSVNGKYVVDEGTIGYPLRGWVGYTNTGDPISGMTMECSRTDSKDSIATATTDSSGNFSFPKLKPGKYFLKGTRREKGTDGRSVRVSTDTVMVSVSDKKSDVVACFVAEAEADSR
jgi:hypothetical protein